MSWAHPLVFAFIPAALLAAWWSWRRSRSADGPVFANINRLWADRRGLSGEPTARRRRFLRGAFLAAGAALALLALARPQWGEIAEPSYEQSREVVLALDLSRSMLADDVAPNRLTRAKLLVTSLLDQLKGERVGLIVFAGTAFVQSPLSADYEVLRDFLAELEPSYLPQGGTDYEPMLRTARQAFGQEGDGDRYLVVLSDGEALDQNWKGLVPSLRERGIRVVGLGVGTPAGALVPDEHGGLVKDEQGAAVLSRLEPGTLQELAAETGGIYRDAATWVDIAELVDATVAQGQRGDYVEHRNVRLQDRYQWVLAPAVLFLLLSYWLEFPLSPLARALPTRGRRPHPASAPAIAAALLALAAWQTPRLASAAVPDTQLQPSPSGTASQPNPLTATVADLSAQPALAPADYARLATATIAFAAQPNAPQDSARAGVIDDALAAVDRGETADAQAADWPALRAQLEQLKQAKEPPPQEQPNPPQHNQQEQNQDGQNGQQEQQGSAGSAGGSPAESENDAADQQQNAGTENSDRQRDAKGNSEQANQPPQGSESNQDEQAGSDAKRPDAASAGEHQPPDAEQQPDPEQHAGQPSADPSGDQSERKQEQQEAGGGEVRRQDETKPLAAPEAGLAEQDHEKATEKDREPTDAAQPAAEPAAEQPPANTRLVGGGPALPSAESQGDTALAQALGTMEHVKDGDAPAVLFDRMNRAEGQPRTAQNGKNW